jgi:hypothetical protein
LPFGRGKVLNPGNAIASYLVGGWQLNTIVNLNSGTPYYVTYSGDLANTGRGFVKANVVGNPKPANRTPAQWINTAAFATPAPFTFGTMGRNSLRSDWNKNWDLSLFRIFPLIENCNLEFRAEAFNVTNTAVFSAPSSTINATNFGVVNSTANSPRELQLALKLSF